MDKGKINKEWLEKHIEEGKSGNPDILKQIKKPGTVRGFLATSEKLKKYPQLFTCGLYMLGFEGETCSQMVDTLNFSIKMDLSWSHWSVYQDIGETDLKKRSRKAYNDWLPSLEKKHGASQSHSGSIHLTGRDIYSLPPEKIPDAAMRQEMWFGFNLISNYLCNKNLQPGARTQDLNRWLRGLQMSYPTHPIMSLFLSLGHCVLGERPEADRQFLKALHEVRDSPYWAGRFKDYGLDEILDAYPLENPQPLLQSIMKGYGCESSSPEPQRVLALSQ